MALFEDCVFYISEDKIFDQNSSVSRDDLEDLISKFGGLVVANVNARVTHCIDINSKGDEAKRAKMFATIKCVNPEWVNGCIVAGKVLGIGKYKPSTGALPKEKKTTEQKKRKKEEAEADEVLDKGKEDEDEVIAPPKPKEQKVTQKVIVKGRAAVDAHVEKQVAKNCHVLDEGGEEIWDSTLNQTNIGQNNNKFFILQVLEEDGNKGKYYFFTRWGRVGMTGQKKMEPCKTVEAAKAAFKKKFKEKTGNGWEERGKFVSKANKYVLIHKDYKIEEQEIKDKLKDKKKAQAEAESVPSKLDKEVQDLVALITDEQMMQGMLKSFEFDIGKAPLGALKEATLRKGLAKLKEIEQNLSSSKAVLSQLSSEYYTFIPHNFGTLCSPSCPLLFSSFSHQA